MKSLNILVVLVLTVVVAEVAEGQVTMRVRFEPGTAEWGTGSRIPLIAGGIEELETVVNNAADVREFYDTVLKAQRDKLENATQRVAIESGNYWAANTTHNSHHVVDQNIHHSGRVDHVHSGRVLVGHYHNYPVRRSTCGRYYYWRGTRYGYSAYNTWRYSGYWR